MPGSTALTSRRWLPFHLLVLVLLLGNLPIQGQTNQDTPPEKTLQQRTEELQKKLDENDKRIEDLQTYFNSSSPVVRPEAQAGEATVWIVLAAVALVFLILPLFFRQAGWLQTCAHFFAICGWGTLVWLAVGYTLVFARVGTASGWSFLGDFRYAFVQGIDQRPNLDYAAWVSQSTFAISHLVLVLQALTILWISLHRLRFRLVLVAMTGWLFLVYFPLAHALWGSSGLMNGLWNREAPLPAIDCAGGLVVEAVAGLSALVFLFFFETASQEGHSAADRGRRVFIVSAVVWTLGALAFAFQAPLIFLAGALGWTVLESLSARKFVATGLFYGAVSANAAVAASFGFVTPEDNLMVALLAGIFSFLAVAGLKSVFQRDWLAICGAHGLGGLSGAMAVGWLATETVNSNLVMMPGFQDHTFPFQQMVAVALAVAWATGGSALIGCLLRKVVTPVGHFR